MTASSVLSMVALVGAAPALPGIATRTRAFLTGRRGAPVLQLYWDLARLARKSAVLSRTTTTVFRVAPIGVVASLLVAASLLPLDGRDSAVSFAGDLVLFAGLLALGRFLLVLAALDTGSSFEGMGASREVTVGAFAEPGILLSFGALVAATGQLSLGSMLSGALGRVWPVAGSSLVMVGVALFIILLAEGSRGPVDDPATHLELTMIHEVMVLDHSGPDLGLVLYGGALKIAVFGSLVVGVLVPRAGLPAPLGTLVLLAGLVVVSVGIGFVEAIMARLRMDRVPQLLVAASALAALAGILVVR